MMKIQLLGIGVLLVLFFVIFLLVISWRNRQRSRELQASVLTTQELSQIKQVPVCFRALDYLLVPAMFVFNKFHLPVMETHPWHPQNIHCDLIPDDIGEKIVGDDESKFGFRHSGLIHLPFLGGWTKYLVLEAQDFDKYWHVGWKVSYLDQAKGRFCQVHRLRIYGSRIMVLAGTGETEGMGFGVNDRGELIPVRVIGRGTIGDGKFPGVRLF